LFRERERRKIESTLIDMSFVNVFRFGEAIDKHTSDSRVMKRFLSWWPCTTIKVADHPPTQRSSCLRALTCTYNVPLSPSSISWYRQKFYGVLGPLGFVHWRLKVWRDENERLPAFRRQWRLFPES